MTVQADSTNRPPTVVRGQGFWPSVDGAVIPYQPLAAFEAGIHHRVPIIVGTSVNSFSGRFILKAKGR